MPPYVMYRGGLLPSMMSGRYFSASSSHVVTCARMSFTDQSPVIPGSVSCEPDKPAYDSLISTHALLSFFRRCCLFMVQGLLPPIDAVKGVRKMYHQGGRSPVPQGAFGGDSGQGNGDLGQGTHPSEQCG